MIIYSTKRGELRRVDKERREEEMEQFERTMSHNSNNVHQVTLCYNYGRHIDVTHLIDVRDTEVSTIRRYNSHVFVQNMCSTFIVLKVPFLEMYSKKHKRGENVFWCPQDQNVYQLYFIKQNVIWLDCLVRDTKHIHSVIPFTISPPLLNVFLPSFSLPLPLLPPLTLWVMSSHIASGLN